MNNNEIFFILMIIIFTLIIIKLSHCNLIEKFEQEEKYMQITRNDDLIKNYRKYNEDLKYYMHIHFDYYVKDTNKAYARYITQLDRSRVYYQDKLSKLNYPFIIRKESDGYYIDYQLPNRMINNKVADISWDDFNSTPQILLTFYDAPDEFILHISDILKNFDNVSYQYSNSKVDMLYDEFIYKRRVLNDITQTLKPLGLKLIDTLETTIKAHEEELKSIDVNKTKKNIQLMLENKFGKELTNRLETQVQNEIQKQIDDGLEEKIITKVQETIKGSTPYVKAEALKYLNKINVSDVSLFTQNSYIEISIEARDYRFIYIYDRNDPDADSELIDLIKYMNDVENLDYFSDYYTKDLRYFRVPINVIRVIIKMGEYLKIF